MGVVTPLPLRTYPDGFPDDVARPAASTRAGAASCATGPTAARRVIDDFGERHLATGDLIVYTSADSVLQIAAHVDEVPPAELYAVCAAAREIMSGEHAVGRVIARPFRGDAGRVRAHRRPQGPRAAAARALLHGRAAGRRRAGAHGRQDRAGVRRRRRRRPAQGRDQRGGAGGDGGADRRARRRVRVHQPRRDRPGLRPPRRRPRLPRGAEGDRRRGRARGSSAWTRRATCSSSPPTTAATRRPRAPTTRASTCRCSRASTATAGGATTVRSRTSARRCCSWLTGRDAPLPGTPFL